MVTPSRSSSSAVHDSYASVGRWKPAPRTDWKSAHPPRARTAASAHARGALPGARRNLIGTPQDHRRGTWSPHGSTASARRTGFGDRPHSPHSIHSVLGAPLTGI